MNDITIVVRTGGNPVPYKRTTQRQKYADSDYRRYIEYKSIVVAEFVASTGRMPHMMLQKNRKYAVETKAYFKDRKHADMSNVHKGAEDAIFAKPLNDKYLSGSFDYDYDAKDPRLVITIREA